MMEAFRSPVLLIFLLVLLLLPPQGPREGKGKRMGGSGSGVLGIGGRGQMGGIMVRGLGVGFWGWRIEARGLVGQHLTMCKGESKHR